MEGGFVDERGKALQALNDDVSTPTSRKVARRPCATASTRASTAPAAAAPVAPTQLVAVDGACAVDDA
jgi:hypothetical protein